MHYALRWDRIMSFCKHNDDVLDSIGARYFLTGRATINNLITKQKQLVR
jgi:hypothetical protein